MLRAGSAPGQQCLPAGNLLQAREAQQLGSWPEFQGDIQAGRVWIQEKWWVARKEPALGAEKRGRRAADRSPLAAPLLPAGGAAGHLMAGPQEQACLRVGRLQASSGP